MLTVEDYAKIKEIVSASNAKHIIMEIINTYGLQSPENASFILDEATKLSIFVMQHYGQKAAQYKECAGELMKDDDSDVKPGEYNLLHLLRICMPVFPDGVVQSTNTSDEIKYFDRLLSILKPTEHVFYWDSKEDWKWARKNGVDSYLKLLNYKHRLSVK